MKRVFVWLTVAVFAWVGKGEAHEFWIDPEAFQVAPGDTVEANLRTGEEYLGAPSSYLPRNFARFDMIESGELRAVEGRLGDIPAFNVPDLEEGLLVIIHQTQEQRLTWDEWERFFNFASHKDLGDIVALQGARGLDQENVREGYIRYAKSLVAVGDAAGEDTRVGLHTELVALANPYTDDLSEGFPVRLWLEDTPRAFEQVEMFRKAPDGSVEVTLHRTDADGIAVLPVEPGYRYMLDAVALEAVEPEGARDPEWLTHWANLTFEVPG